MTDVSEPGGAALLDQPVRLDEIVEIEQNGVTVATAAVAARDDVVRISFEVAHGHLAREVRPALVEAAFALLDTGHPHLLQASLPAGDTELLELVAARSTDGRTRQAGATCLIDAVTTGDAGASAVGPGRDRD